MDLSLSEQEQQLKDSVLSFVEREATTTVLVDLQESETGFEQKWLASMADAGWLGALVSPEFGGVGANALEAALICEALGSGPVPGPFLASSVVSAALLGAADPSAGRDATLAAIAEGHAVVVPACTVPGRSWDGLKTGLPAESSGDAVTLSHTLSYVPYAAGASHVLVPLEGSPTDRRRFALVATDLPGVTSRLLPGFLARNYEVSLDQVAVGEDALLTIGSPESLRDALALAYILVAAYQVGGCSSLLDRSVAYSNTRVQFGMPVGRFQRVQDHIVELLNALDAASRGGWVRLECRADTEVIFTIEDTGAGIPADAMNHIFEPFFTTKASGSGLGLPIVHAIVTQHGGSIGAENVPGGGGRFTVRFPRPSR